MAIREVIKYPHPNLKLVCREVTVFDETLRRTVDDMFETMYHDEGIGLAAPQIDLQLRLVVIDTSEDKSQRIVMINPKFILKEGSQGIDEGCLSVPLGYRARVERAARVIVEFQNEFGEKQTLEATDLLAICIQHEIDHLDGILFIDHLSPLKRSMFAKKMAKAERLEKKNK